MILRGLETFFTFLLYGDVVVWLIVLTAIAVATFVIFKIIAASSKEDDEEIPVRLLRLLYITFVIVVIPFLSLFLYGMFAEDAIYSTSYWLARYVVLVPFVLLVVALIAGIFYKPATPDDPLNIRDKLT